MRISPVHTYRQSFGHISTRVVDMIRNDTEDYIPGNNNSNHPQNNYYIANAGYNFLDKEQLSRLHKLTARASKLYKSVIDTSGNNWAECLARTIVVRSHCFGGGDRSNIRVFPLEQEGNGDDALDVLEKAVEFAEATESDPCAHNVFDEYGWHGGVRECKPIKYRFNRFYGIPENQLLSSIYSYTINFKTLR